MINSVALLMYEELILGASTTIQIMSRMSVDHEIQALACGYHGLLKLNDDSVDLDDVIMYFDNASSLYLKYDMIWDCIFYSLISCILNRTDGIQKFGTRCSLIPIKDKFDNCRAALCIELCALHCDLTRKKMFQLVMAGHLYNQSGLLKLSKRCYLLSLPIYINSQWYIPLEHLYGILSRFDPYYSIYALNILCNTTEFNFINDNTPHCVTDDYNLASEHEISYLKRLMKLSFMEDIKDEFKIHGITCKYNNYPSLFIKLYDLPHISNDILTPFPVRIPLIYLKNKEGVPGKNCYLTSLDNIDRYGIDIFKNDNIYDDYKLKEESIYNLLCNDDKFVKCRVFYDSIIKNIKRRDVTPSLIRSFNINTFLILQLDLINPLHIPIHCDDYYLLIKDVENDELFWIQCDILDYPTCNIIDHLYLVELQRRIIFIKFKLKKSGKFIINGIRWKLFNCVYFWTPLYLSGDYTTPGYTICNKDGQLLDEFINNRRANNGLTFIITDREPKIKFKFIDGGGGTDTKGSSTRHSGFAPDYTTLSYTSPEVQSNSVRPAVSSSNYLSLKGNATPGDRGEGSDGSSIMGMMEDGAKDVLDWTSSGIPESDPRELEGEVNREADGRTSSGEAPCNGKDGSQVDTACKTKDGGSLHEGKNPSLPSFRFFVKRGEYLEYDKMVMNHVSWDDLLYDRVNKDDDSDILDVVDIISGEYLFTQLCIINIGQFTLNSLSLRLKCIGNFKYPCYPMGFITSSNGDINPTWTNYIYDDGSKYIERIFDISFNSNSLLKPHDQLKIYFLWCHYTYQMGQIYYL